MSRCPRGAVLGVLILTLVTPTGLAVASAPPPAPTDSIAGRLVDPPAPTIPRRYLEQEITWSTCTFDAHVKQLHPQAPTTNCAKVEVPMDWNNPDTHPDITLAIAHSKATGVSQGLLATNPGGPAEALDMSAFLATAKPRLFTDFDLLGFDPRGFGDSERPKCPTTVEKLDSIPFTPDHRERTEQTVAAEITWGNIVSDACSKAEFAQFVNTQQIVHDLEFLRALFKAPKLNYIGYSYGTMLGGWYADTYPSRVGRFVLDSNMGFSDTWQKDYDRVPRSAQRRFDKQFVPWLARHADQIEGLGHTPTEVTAKYEAVRAGLVTLVKAGVSVVRGDDLDSTIFGDLYGNTGMVIGALDLLVHDEYAKAPSAAGIVELEHVDQAYARLGAKLRQYYSVDQLRQSYGVAPGQPAAAASARTKTHTTPTTRRPATSSSSDELVELDAGFWAVMCNDTRWSTDVARYRREAEWSTARYPFAGYINGVAACAFWKYPAQDRVIDLKGAPGVLMVQSELDVITAYEGALQAHRDTRWSTRFVAVDDEGQHGQYIGGPSSCVEGIGDRYVFDGVLPAGDVVCGTSPLPGDAVVHRVNGPVNGKATHSSNGEKAAPSRSSALERVLQAAATLR